MLSCYSESKMLMIFLKIIINKDQFSLLNRKSSYSRNFDSSYPCKSYCRSPLFSFQECLNYLSGYASGESQRKYNGHKWDCDIVHNNICTVFWHFLGKKDNLDYVLSLNMLPPDVFVMTPTNGLPHIFYRCLNGRGHSVVEGGG